jgi:hypothetical protein
MGNMGKDIYPFVQSFVLCIYLVTFIIAFWLPNKREIPDYMKNFYWFPLVGSMVTIIILLNAYGILSYSFAHYVNAVSIFFHYVFLSRFIYIVCNRNKRIKIIAIFFFMITTFFIVYDFFNFSYIAISISNASLLLMCLFYFYLLFTSPVKSKPSKEPSFWICCGIFLGSAFIIPSSAFLRYLGSYSSSVGYILVIVACFGFAIMYLFFMKAFLCLPTLRKS